MYLFCVLSLHLWNYPKIWSFDSSFDLESSHKVDVAELCCTAQHSSICLFCPLYLLKSSSKVQVIQQDRGSVPLSRCASTLVWQGMMDSSELSITLEPQHRQKFILLQDYSAHSFKSHYQLSYCSYCWGLQFCFCKNSRNIKNKTTGLYNVTNNSQLWPKKVPAHTEKRPFLEKLNLPQLVYMNETFQTYKKKQTVRDQETKGVNKKANLEVLKQFSKQEEVKQEGVRVE